MIRLRVMDDGPFPILVQESPYRRQESRAAIFAAFAKDLCVVPHNPATYLASVALEFIGQRIRRMPRVDTCSPRALPS